VYQFNYWIENNALINLGLAGPRYTWARGHCIKTREYARLDRGLCNEQWRLMFEEASVQHVIQTKLDHSPLLISLNGLASAQSMS